MNAPGQEILTAAINALARSTGLTALAARERHKPLSPADALITIETGRGAKHFAAAIKAVDRFQTPAQVKAQLARRTELPLLVAPFISRQTAAHAFLIHIVTP